MALAPKNAVAGIVVAGCILGLTLAASAGLSSAFRSLHQIWTQVYAAFAHGYLVLALAAWLGARRWRSNPPISLEPCWLAAVPTLAIGAAIASLDNLGLGATRLALLPALLTCAIWWVLGTQVARIVLLPAALIHFALPPWALLDRPLQWLTTFVVNAAVNFSAIPAHVEGNQFHLPAGTFEIALGCSGLNYLITALALFFYHGAAYLTNWRERARVLCAAAAIAVVANWLRVYLLIYIGYLSDMQHYLVRVEHHYFGWVLFAVMIWPVLRWAVSLEPHVSTTPVAPTAYTRLYPTRIAIAGASATAALAGLSVLTPAPAATPPSLASLPSAVGNWRAENTRSIDWAPKFETASTDLQEYANADGAVVMVFRAAYARQSADRRLNSTGNDLLGNAAIINGEWHEDLDMGGRSLPVTTWEVATGDRRVVLWTVRAVGGIPYRSRLEELRATLRSEKGRSEAVLVAWTAACAEDCTAAHSTVRAAITDMASTMLALGTRPTGPP